MTRASDKHIDEKELAALASPLPASAQEPDYVSGLDLEEAQRHIDACDDCGRRMQLWKQVQEEISRLGPSIEPSPGADCPATADWNNVALGLMSENDAMPLMIHAAQCDYCGPRFRQAAHLLADATADEERVIADLKTSKVDWRHAFAQRLTAQEDHVPLDQQVAKSSIIRSTKSFSSRWWPRLTLVACILIVAMAAWLVSIRPKEPDANQLLAQAYTEQRTLELRIGDAQHAPLRIRRGADISPLDRPSALLDAEALVAHKLASHREDAMLLEMRGRAELLEWKYDAALDTLRHALELKTDSLSIRIDLASAHFERAEKISDPSDYAAANELLSQVIQNDPKDSIALFNRAIICQRLGLYSQAISDWNDYLRIDPNGTWADEAKQRLKELEDEKKRHENIGSSPITTVPSIESIKSSREIREEFDARLDDYFDHLLLRWLPEKYEPGKQNSNQSAQEAVAVFSSLLLQLHSDGWLSELTRVGDHVSLLSAAFTELAKSVNMGHSGDFRGALRAATESRKLFSVAGNRPAALRAELEEIYELHRMSAGPECVRRSKALELELANTSFTWMQTQTALEEAICFGLVNDFRSAELYLSRGIDTSRRFHFTSLTLRGLGLSSYSAWRMLGNSSRAWALATEGLQSYWTAPFSPMRAYQFYGTEQFVAEDAKQFQLALILARAAVETVMPLHDIPFESMARYRLAQAAIRAGAKSEAEHELLLATKILDSLPKDNSVDSYRAFASIRLANLQIDDNPEMAFTNLKELPYGLASVSNPPLLLDLYANLALSGLRSGHLREAESAFQQAVSYLGPSLATLQDPRDRLGAIETFDRVYREYVDLKLMQGQNEEALVLWETYRGLTIDSQAIAGITEKAEFTQRRDKLTSETVVSFMQTQDVVRVWVFDDRGTRFFRLAATKVDLLTTANRLLRNCSNPDSNLSTLRLDARRLYVELVKPWISGIPVHRKLVLEVDGDVALVPFRTLIDDQGRYFFQDHTLVLSPGLFARDRLKNPQSISANTRALVITASNSGDAHLPTLDVKGEAAAVAKSIANTTVIPGNEDHYNQIQSLLARVNIFHFVGHTGHIPGTGSQPLIFQNSTQENAAQLFRSFYGSILRRSICHQCSLAVLSGCSTAKMGTERAAYPDNLVRGLLSAGVPNVVASRWDVDSAATSALMTRFYSELTNNASPAIALASADEHLIKESSTSHPYYWAAFEIFGK